MDTSNFDLNLLVVFNAIYEEKNLTRAGQRLRLTQPAISHSLNRLRSAFNNQLFVRHGHQMVPTPLAEKLKLRVQEILELTEGIVEGCENFDPSRSVRSFSIGIQDYPLLVVLPPLIEIINKTAPGISIKASHLRKEDRKIALEDGKLDMVIGVKQEFGSNINQQYLFSDREVCIMRTGHPTISSTLTIEQYIGAEFVGLSVSEYEEQAIDVKLKKMGERRKIRLIVENEVTIPNLVANTDLLANVVKLVANAFVSWLPIKILPLPIPITDIKVYQYWHTRHQKEPAHAWLRQTIKNVCETINPNNDD
jgi:DNA-binding transcriptional LysR family regulator